MPQIRPHNVSPADGYSTYLKELDVLLSPETFVDYVLSQLHQYNWIYLTYLDEVKKLDPQAFATHVLREVKVDYPRYMPYLNDVELIDPHGYAEYVSFEIETCYAVKMADIQHQQFNLAVQIHKDEEEAVHHLSDILLKEINYENTLRKEAAMQIYEFFTPEYDDGLFFAETVTELDQILAAQPRYEKLRGTRAIRRQKTVYRKRRLHKNALTVQKNFIRRLDNDMKPTNNCAGFILDHPALTTMKAARIWKRAKKNGFVVGDICASNPNWRKYLLKRRNA